MSIRFNQLYWLPSINPVFGGLFDEVEVDEEMEEKKENPNVTIKKQNKEQNKQNINGNAQIKSNKHNVHQPRQKQTQTTHNPTTTNNSSQMSTN
jgi:hypothetical protein